MDIHKASATKLIGLDKFAIEVQCMEDVRTR